MGQDVNISSRNDSYKYLDENALAYLRHLSFDARGAVDGAYAGKHRSVVKGRSQEFTDYREYLPGDDVRSIDWRVYGRTDRYMIKLCEQETLMTCHLLLDSSASMAFGGSWHKEFFGANDISKYDYACYLAAALSYLLLRQGDAVSLTVFNSAIRYHLPAGGTLSHLHRVARALEGQKVHRDTYIPHVLRQAFPLLKRRGILIVISDFLEDCDGMFEALDMYLGRGFEVALFHVLHRYELELPKLASVNFVDAESGERLTSVPEDVQEAYGHELQAHIDTIRAGAEARKIDYDLISTQTFYSVAVRDYLERRRRQCGYS
ncbi:MAG: DUF58 domain-containing protein [Phycisphaerales bacterium]|nr:MAG: DUF58 domain-containing protein [Phycisphaerales bacterium]